MGCKQGCAWVELGQPNPSYKSNPIHMGQVKPMGWTILFITIFIKLSRKNISINILKKKHTMISNNVTP